MILAAGIFMLGVGRGPENGSYWETNSCSTKKYNYLELLRTLRPCLRR